MSQKFPLISILINCYNSEKYVADCIKSDQTYPNLEIIVWDNKSTDNTFNIINSFNDKRLKYFTSKKHQSLAYAESQLQKN